MEPLVNLFTDAPLPPSVVADVGTDVVVACAGAEPTRAP